MGREAWVGVLGKLVDGDGLVVWYPRLEGMGAGRVRWVRRREAARRSVVAAGRRVRGAGARGGGMVAGLVVRLWELVVRLWGLMLALFARRRESGYDRLAEIEAGVWEK